ncbi:unnamed protein product, partial [Rotaria socialis]
MSDNRNSTSSSSQKDLTGLNGEHLVTMAVSALLAVIWALRNPVLTETTSVKAQEMCSFHIQNNITTETN